MIMIDAKLTVSPYQRRHRRDVLRLVEDHYRLHIHLDWVSVDEWIDDPNAIIHLAWERDRLLGVMSVTEPLGGSSWLRLALVHDDADPDQVFGALWPGLHERLRSLQTRDVAVLLLRPWLSAHLPPLGFSIHENVVTLARNNAPIPPPLRDDLILWHGNLRDLEAVVMVDHAAFMPRFRMTADSIRAAIRSANSFTLASLDDQVIGYQLSMRYSDGGHLARLATVPTAQGAGVGGSLLVEMLTSFQKRGVHYVTVNTQETNQRSLSLYRRFGFELTGLDYPVWALKVG